MNPKVAQFQAVAIDAALAGHMPAGASESNVVHAVRLNRSSQFAATIASMFRCYSEVFLINGSAITGFLIFMATMLNWHLGVSGIIAVLTAYVCSRLIHLDGKFFQPGFYTYNPLLIGLLIGSMLQFSWLTVFFIVVASVFTLLLTIGMVHFFRVHLGLPVLSLPYAVGSVIIYLASLRYSNLLVRSSNVAFPQNISFELPAILAGYLKSLGAVFLLPYECTGLVFALLLLFRSRILFLLAAAGYAAGVLTRAAMLGSLAQSVEGAGNFNFILIAMAIGGVFLVPSVSSYVIATVAVIGSTILLDAVAVYGSFYGLPVYTLPFNIVALGVIYALNLTAFPGMARFIGMTPEDTVEHAAVAKRRYPGEFRSLHLPFFGTWTVWQQADDEWTHQGAWKHAYDFVITDNDSRTFQGAGLKLEDYYCYRKPVVSPVRGRVSTVVSNLADNPIGRVDRTNNWGNYILIYDERGYYVELSHLAEDSITVSPGEWVEPGAVIGKCGNSGYSPQPHLHVHVQYFHAVGAATLPFSFLNYVDDHGAHHANANPTTGMRIKSTPATDTRLSASTDFLIGDVLAYDVYRDGSQIDQFTATVAMAADGSLRFETNRGGYVYFGKSDDTFYIYRVDGLDGYAKLFLHALPRLPLTYEVGLEWEDWVPVSSLIRQPRRALAGLIGSVVPSLAVAHTRSIFLADYRVETEIIGNSFHIKRKATVEFDANRGFSRITVENIELRRAKEDQHGDGAAADSS